MANATIIDTIQKYIDALIGNLDIPVVLSNVNVIFDSGAVNGVFGLGTAMYLHKLELTGRLKVHKISGCSIGSLIALWYSFNCPVCIIDDFEEIFMSYKKTQKFYHYETIVKSIVDRLVKEEEKDIQTLNKRLYITYYDTKKNKKRVISRYKNKQHLIDCILSSSHLPFLTSRAYKYKDRYIDGLTPHFFKKGKNLFIKLTKITQPSLMFSVKNELHMYTRLMKGVNDMNLFFETGGSGGGAEMCFYIDKKSYYMKLQLYIREYLFLFLFALVTLFLKIKKNLPVGIRQNLIYNKLCDDMKNEFKLLIQNHFF